MDELTKSRQMYKRVHRWINRNFKKMRACEICNTVTKTEWSNKSGRYKYERNDWQELCKKCHKRYEMMAHMYGADVSVVGYKKDTHWSIGYVDPEVRPKIKDY